jgi:hypothetical protein
MKTALMGGFFIYEVLKMRVYTSGEKTSLGRHTLLVQPGKKHPEVSEWFNQEKKPIMFNVKFYNGVSDDLPDNLAKFLLDNKYASKSPVIVK